MAKVFISYSHQDEQWKDRVVKQLKVLADLGLEVWDDRRIQAGADWEKDLETALQSCDAALLLISADFLTSAYITRKEVPALLERRESEGLLVIPVILSPVQWQRKLWLKTIQARPKDGKPLSGMTDHDAETALSLLAGEVIDCLAEQTPKTAPHHSAPAAVTTHDEPAADPKQTPSCLQRELDYHLKQAWEDADMAAFVGLLKQGAISQAAYSAALVNSIDAYGDLRDLDTALGKLQAKPPHLLSLEVSNAIAVSALVLYANYNAASLGEAGKEISAANLLYAAFQATVRHGIDLGVRQTDARDGEVSSAMLSPRMFNAYVKGGENDPEWEQIKRSLWVSADALLVSVVDVSHQAIKQRFRERAPKVVERHPRVTDQELHSDLVKAERELGSRFVYFVNQNNPHEVAMALRNRGRLEQEFGVKTVVWREGQEVHAAADRLKNIFDRLYKNTQSETAQVKNQPASTVSGKSNVLETFNSSMEKINNTGDLLSKTVELGDKILDTGAKVAQKAAPLAWLWKWLS